MQISTAIHCRWVGTSVELLGFRSNLSETSSVATLPAPVRSSRLRSYSRLPSKSRRAPRSTRRCWIYRNRRLNPSEIAAKSNCSGAKRWLCPRGVALLAAVRNFRLLWYSLDHENIGLHTVSIATKPDFSRVPKLATDILDVWMA